MDNIRVILWALFASLLYVSYMVWQQDYAPEPVTEIPVDAEAQAVADLPAVAAPADTAAGGDLPPAATQSTPDSAATPALTSNVVNVKTDVLDIDISSKGATLVRADLTAYPLNKDNPDVPVRILNSDNGEHYHLRSGLRSAAQPAAAEATHLADFVARADEFVLADGDDELVIPLIWEQDGIRVEKTYTFKRGFYGIELSQKVTNNSDAPYPVFPYLQIQRFYVPQERSMFNVDSYSFDGPVVFDGDSYEKLDVEDLEEEPLNGNYTNGWIAAIQHHFLSAAVPQGDEPVAYSGVFDGRNYTVTSSSPIVTVAPGATEEFTSNLFVGPKLQGQLDEVSDGLSLTVDYGILALLAQPLFWLLQQVHKFVGNWGWTIIIVTFLIKLAFYKLTETSGRSMAKMRKLQPRLKALQERYKDDRQAMSAALMDLYKREKVNPAAGCLPMLVQIPFFIAFYWVLLESVEMRQAPFMLWITDLSSRDPYFVLPLLMGGAMFVQQKLNPAPPDPVQAKVMSILPVVFTVFFAFFPAGLVLYWLTNSVLSVLQQWKINKALGADDA